MNTDTTSLTPETGRTGPPCQSCGSANTSVDSVLRPSPSILVILLFGWIVLLIRGAFAMRSSVCRDCGNVNRYKSVGSWIALVILVGIVALITAAFFVDPG